MNTTDLSPLVALQRHLKIVHHIPGRVRFRVSNLYRNAAMKQRLEAELKRVEGILKVRINIRTSSLLVYYSVEKLVPGTLFPLAAPPAYSRHFSQTPVKGADVSVEPRACQPNGAAAQGQFPMDRALLGLGVTYEHSRLRAGMRSPV